MKRLSLVAFAIILFFLACGNKEVVITEEEIPQPEVALVSSASVELPYTEGDDVVTFNTNREWRAECDAPWISLSSTYGSFYYDKSVTIKIHYQENESFDDRSATITIIPEEGEKLTVCYTQASTPYLKTIQEEDIFPTIGPEGGILEYHVQTNVDFDVIPQKNWIHYIETKSIEDKTIILEIDPYERSSYNIREGEVLIQQKDGKYFNLNCSIYICQEGPDFSFYTIHHFAPSEGGEFEFKVYSNVYFDVDAQSDWIHYIKTNTYEDNVYGVVLRFDRNESEARTGTITCVRKSKNPITDISLEQYGNLPVPEAVDMGLSVKWASFNLGASKSDDMGFYYKWGEIIPTLGWLSWANYKWVDDNNPSNVDYWQESNVVFHKYNTNPNYGEVDNKTRLDLEDDAANYILGGNWRIPTTQEFNALRNETYFTWSRTQAGGMYGYLVTSKKTGNSIFLPYTAWQNGANKDEGKPADLLMYWTSDLGNYQPPFYAVCFSNTPAGLICTNNPRAVGLAIRPVTD